MNFIVGLRVRECGRRIYTPGHEQSSRAELGSQLLSHHMVLYNRVLLTIIAAAASSQIKLINKSMKLISTVSHLIV